MSENFEKLVSALMKSGDVKFMIEHPELADYSSTSATDAAIYAIVDSYVAKYGKMPSEEAFVKEYGEPLAEPKDAPAYYLEQCGEVHIRKTLHGASVDAQPHMLKDPKKSLAIMGEAVMALMANQQAAATMDFRESGQRVMKHLASKWSGNKISMGYPSFDKNSGGLMPGDFISLVGFTGIGKTQVLLTRAFHFWQNHNVPVVFISGEMSLNPILERAAALFSHIPADFLKHGLIPNVGPKNQKQKLTKALFEDAPKAEVPLQFVEANLAMTEKDILRICHQYRPGVLCVDGAATLGGRSYGRRWEQIASMATFLKQAICQGLGIPCIASYQFTNEARKEFKKKQGIPSLPDIAGSAEIANLSTVCLGMTQDNTPETTHHRQIAIMKGRNGESGTFYIHWDWVAMNFEEYIEPTAPELDDLDDLDYS